ncbi:DUF4351 domain-containing protein [Sphaerospermopsis aphanizomenoides BCCUSP55]|uniref:DUF4351 domain-containing protein n=1 Tax=Sphaerospermopsis aphanizomenoides TaxID=459663 RepID=UPI0019068AD3|nr:DUF4351 domain-containing protein [Sphaerospermopsis aphanizomenoides]MBK1989636.1 DUF4351 domain-containing protein [Sphaerospermopsis aphanizomenoides BCCUSP55]
MTRFIHDQFAKDYLEELLKPFGKVEASTRVAGEVREIDVLFTPFPEQADDIKSLGLLGKLAATPAIFEPYRNPVSKEEICDCLLKLLEVRGALQREAKRNQTTIVDNEIPKLWILTPTASKNLLSGFNGIEKSDSLPGIYFLAEYLRTAIVVIHKLPCTTETLWLRLLGRGKVQKLAIDELAALPSNQPYVKITLELLYNLQQNLRINQSSQTEDRELIMRLAPLYQQDRELARQEGLQEGLKKEQQLIIRQLNRRIGEIDSSLIQRIQTLSVEQLEDLGEALLDFGSVADLEAWFQSVN